MIFRSIFWSLNDNLYQNLIYINGMIVWECTAVSVSLATLVR